MRTRLARRMGAVCVRPGELEQPRDLGVDVQSPAAVLVEPAAQLARMPAHEPERVRVGAVAQERVAQQGAGGARQVAVASFLERRFERRAHATSLRAFAVRSTICRTWSVPRKTPASVWIATGLPPGMGASTISSDPSPVVVRISR